MNNTDTSSNNKNMKRKLPYWLTLKKEEPTHVKEDTHNENNKDIDGDIEMEDNSFIDDDEKWCACKEQCVFSFTHKAATCVCCTVGCSCDINDRFWKEGC